MTYQLNLSGKRLSAPLVALVLVISTGLSGCASERSTDASGGATAVPEATGSAKTPPPSGRYTRDRVVDIEPGVPGGILEETSTTSVKVVKIDHATRRLTLADEAGDKADFIASDVIRNLDQLRAGDKVTATLKTRQVVYVRPPGSDEAGANYSAAVARARKGAKPGVVFAEAYEVIATVAAIDRSTRVATLRFADGSTRDVTVRPDIDLANHEVGDNVIIRITSTLAILTKSETKGSQ